MIVSLKKPNNVAPGIGEDAYFSLLSWFGADGLKTPKAPFTEPGDEVTIKETHEFNTGLGGFLKFSLAPQKNKLDGKGIGELIGQQFAFELNVVIPGSYIEQHSLMKQLLNKPIIVLVKDPICANDTWYQIGSACSPAYLSHNFATGTLKDGQKGYNCVISAIASSIVLYTGKVKVFEEPFAGNGLPVFFDANPIDNISLTSIRNRFVNAASRNIFNIYTIVAANNGQKNVFVQYRDSDGNTTTGCLFKHDLSTFSKFVNVLQSFLPTERTLDIYGTNLLVVHPGTEEHYLGIYMEEFEYLVDGDGSFLVDIDDSFIIGK